MSSGLTETRTPVGRILDDRRIPTEHTRAMGYLMWPDLGPVPSDLPIAKLNRVTARDKIKQLLDAS
jgi:hypothetical protein